MSMDLTTRIKKLYSFKVILLEISLKKLKAKYSGSILGLWWALILPVTLALAINLVFSRVLLRHGEEHFTLFLLSGLLPWLFFANTLNNATNSFTSSVSELRQNIFPRELIPLSYVIADFLNFLFGFLVILPVFLFFKISVVVLLPHLLIILTLFLLFSAGIGLLFSCWNVFFRDLQHIMSVAMMVWFWLTPVFYSADNFGGLFRFLLFLNPLTPFVDSFQKILFRGVAPSFLETSLCIVLALFFCVSGYLFFIKKEAALLKKI